MSFFVEHRRKIWHFYEANYKINIQHQVTFFSEIIRARIISFFIHLFILKKQKEEARGFKGATKQFWYLSLIHLPKHLPGRASYLPASLPRTSFILLTLLDAERCIINLFPHFLPSIFTHIQGLISSAAWACLAISSGLVW